MQYAMIGTGLFFASNCTVDRIIITARWIFILSYQKTLENTRLHW